MDSENAGSGYLAHQKEMQPELGKQLKALSDQVTQMHQELGKQLNALTDQITLKNQDRMEEKMSRMKVDEDFIPKQPMDIIALVYEKYGPIADSYLKMIHPLNPGIGIFEPSEQSVAVFGKNLQSIFGYLPKVFPSDREKIAFLYSKSPENYQRQIRKLVKFPGPQRTFKTVFEQTFLNESEKYWFHPIPKYLAKGARGELDVDEIHKWLDGLDMNTIKKVVVFAFHSNYFRNELLKHNYEHGNHAAAVKTVNDQVRYTRSKNQRKVTVQSSDLQNFIPKEEGDNHADKPKPKAQV
ncbi:hypothetical protein SPOG_03540 [Schizosaccharomyces cryophilus OY26]|uniref:Uncharacterized protein n=1 Tax=Schizosaccharomyces cryophilus (strain OY26 / ATCC MYA-4695 / CBS 11777 / NBRC 106824 / NRRL Y48691) TaxID=653667 RepID=S9X8B9_SCHCR|nr:uncharacterized protein SPOG_03540 [Schizosaccharomyces cryophilus OY26]EPY50071.1 hypothetical protein SPOG_03540 [Schizosaccharomyces cryophilus OY26]